MKRAILHPEIRSNKVHSIFWGFVFMKIFVSEDHYIWDCGPEDKDPQGNFCCSSTTAEGEWNMPSCKDTKRFQRVLTSASLGSFWTFACDFLISTQTPIWIWTYNLLDSLALQTYWNFSRLCLTPMTFLFSPFDQVHLQVMFISLLLWDILS